MPDIECLVIRLSRTHGRRQRTNNKPISEEYNIWVLAEAFGHAFQFEPYQGVKKGKQVDSSTKCSSGHRRCSVRKDVLRNFAKFTGKHLYKSLFFNKAANLRSVALLKMRLCFPVNFVKFLRTPFLQNTSWRLLL